MSLCQKTHTNIFIGLTIWKWKTFLSYKFGILFEQVRNELLILPSYINRCYYITTLSVWTHNLKMKLHCFAVAIRNVHMGLSCHMHCNAQNMVDSNQIFYYLLSAAQDKLLFDWIKKPFFYWAMRFHEFPSLTNSFLPTQIINMLDTVSSEGMRTT